MQPPQISRARSSVRFHEGLLWGFGNALLIAGGIGMMLGLMNRPNK